MRDMTAFTQETNDVERRVPLDSSRRSRHVQLQGRMEWATNGEDLTCSLSSQRTLCRSQRPLPVVSPTASNAGTSAMSNAGQRTLDSCADVDYAASQRPMHLQQLAAGATLDVADCSQLHVGLLRQAAVRRSVGSEPVRLVSVQRRRRGIPTRHRPKAHTGRRQRTWRSGSSVRQAAGPW